MNCVESLFQMKKNDGVDFAMINIIRPSVRGFKDGRNS